jgi:hypothetical protein
MCALILLMCSQSSFSRTLIKLGAATLVFFIFTNIWFLWARKKHPEWKVDPAMVFSIFWGIAAGISVLCSMFFAFDSEKQQVHAFLCALAGAAAGWCIGMYLTPQDATERGQFAKLGAAAAVLASGYGIKTLQDLAVKPTFKDHAWYLVISGLSALLTTATIYNTRAYGTNFVKIGFDKTPDKDGMISVPPNGTIRLKAAVSGQDDTSVSWYVLPAGAGAIADGVFTLAANVKDPFMIKAESVSDRTLCDVVKVKVT